MLVIAATLVLLTACNNNNNNQFGAGDRTYTPDTTNVANTPRNNQDQNFQRLSTGNTHGPNGVARGDVGQAGDDRVARIINSSQQYLGQKMNETTFVERAVKNAGYMDFDLRNPYKKIINYVQDMQPGDVLHLDKNGDGHVDHYAILLSDTEIIHANDDGIVEITDLANESNWTVVHVQRVF